MLTPTLRKLGPPGLRRAVAEHWPNPHIQEAIRIIDVLKNTSREIYESKIRALKDDDGSIKQQVQEPRDIMGILRKLDYYKSYLALRAEPESGP
jgi:hypothetical protein